MIFPQDYSTTSIAQLLDAGAYGRVARAKAWARSIVERPDALAEVLAFVESAEADVLGVLEGDLVAFLDYLSGGPNAEVAAFLAEAAGEHAADLDEELMQALMRQGSLVVEPLLVLAASQEEEDRGDLLFVLAHLGVKDERILQLLTEYLEFAAEDGAMALAAYGDAAAIPLLEEMAKGLDTVDPDQEHVRTELESAVEALRKPEPLDLPPATNPVEFYPEFDTPQLDDFEEKELLEALTAEDPRLRGAVVTEFFQRDYDATVAKRLHEIATEDGDAGVRGKALAALAAAAQDPVIEELLTSRLKDSSRSLEERVGAAIGLHAEFARLDDPALKDALIELYAQESVRSQVLEAMWRTLDRSLGEYAARHLDDANPEIRKQAILGVGYLSVGTAAKKLEELFGDEEFRDEALYAYALCLPTEISRGRVKGLLRKIGEIAEGLSEEEQGMVETALDERLLLNGMQPVFHVEGEEEHEGHEHA